VEFAETHPDLHIEFSRLLQHQGAGMPRSEAWRCMAERVRVPEIDAFASMVAQTERFGTPIARALAELSALSRQKRTQAAEQAAAKTTVKISFPLVLFIFPCIFIVLLGPALITMSRSLAGIFR
jgi:tight adherence protein C